MRISRIVSSSRVVGNVLVINCGSSSIKFQIINSEAKLPIVKGSVERHGMNSSKMKVWNDQTKCVKEDHFQTILNHESAFQKILQTIEQHQFIGVGHRVVHGGDYFKGSVIVDRFVKSRIEQLSELAPLHNPVNLLGIQIAEKLFPNIPQVAVFDTAFHQTMPERAHRYAIPEKWYSEFQIRRYGFHGISHSYVMDQAIQLLGSNLAIVSAHLGNGCSVAASLNGQCQDTSMGFSPLEGLVMGQRSGDIDPTVIPFLSKKLDCSSDQVIQMLNKESGFFGLTCSSDSRDLEEKYLTRDLTSRMAIEIFCYRLAKYISSYLVPLGRLDLLIFTGGIGENSSIKRKRVLELLRPLGFDCDDTRNSKNGQDSMFVITKEGSSPKAMVIQTNEELVIAKETFKLISKDIKTE